MRLDWPLVAGTLVLFGLGMYLQGFDAVTGPTSIRFTAGMCLLLAGVGLCLLLDRRRD